MQIDANNLGNDNSYKDYDYSFATDSEYTENELAEIEKGVDIKSFNYKIKRWVDNIYEWVTKKYYEKTQKFNRELNQDEVDDIENEIDKTFPFKLRKKYMIVILLLLLLTLGVTVSSAVAFAQSRKRNIKG